MADEPAEAKLNLPSREQRCSVARTSDVLDIIGSDTSASKFSATLSAKACSPESTADGTCWPPPEHGPRNLGENDILVRSMPYSSDTRTTIRSSKRNRLRLHN
jgi:hypothetical protein